MPLESPEIKEKQPTKEGNPLNFIKEVAKYFMDFLETDFHKRKNPRRCIKLHSEDNLLLGVSLNKYASFAKVLSKLVAENFKKDSPIDITKNTYKTPIPRTLLELIGLQIESISSDQTSLLIEAIKNKLAAAASIHSQDYELALNTALQDSAEIIKESLVLPFITHLEKSLQNYSGPGKLDQKTA